MLKSIMSNRYQRALSRLYNGTLLERLKFEWRNYIKPKRLGWWNSQFGAKQKICTIIQPGVKICLYFDSELAKLIFCENYEWHERLFINSFLKPGDVFIDIGANIGLFSLIAAKRIGNSGKVYAFEPNPIVSTRLAENIKLNRFNNIIRIQAAISDEEGEFPFYLSQDGYDAWNSFARPVAGDNFITENVKSIRWDDFAKDHNLIGSVTMMKIDVEGWEIRVLKGAINTLSRKDAPVLIVEFTEEAAVSAGTSCKELYYGLEDLGYRIFKYDTISRKIYFDPPREIYSYSNLIATKDPNYINNRLRRSFFNVGRLK